MSKNLFTEEISVSNKHVQQRKFTITLSTFSVVQHIPKKTKHRDIISRSTSNNSRQTQDLPGAHQGSQNQSELAESKVGLFIV